MKYVLFVCTQNAGRSQMASAFFDRHAPEGFRSESAGRSPRAEGIWPEVVAAMAEVDVDLSDRKPTRLSVEAQLHADWAVTLACGAACPFVAAFVEDWDVADPAGRPIKEVRQIRDDIERRVHELVANRLELISADRSAHELRLQKLLPDLIDEFAGVRSDGEIRACADTILEGFADVPVRSHVMTIAARKTRECLRAERCEALAP